MTIDTGVESAVSASFTVSNNKRKERTNMSLCVAYAGDSTIYLAADSRIVNNTATQIIDEKYNKIVQIPERNLFVMFAGQATFFTPEEQSFREIIEGIDFSGCNQFPDIYNLIYETFFPLYLSEFGDPLNIIIAGFMHEKLCFKEITFFNNGVFMSVDEWINKYIYKEDRIFLLGTNNAKGIFSEMIKKSSVPELFHEDSLTVHSMQDIYRAVSQNDHTVGQITRILKIRPQGYEWLL